MIQHNIIDTTAPLNHFAKNGYYTVGNKIFNHNIYAYQEATKTNNEIKWHFNDEVFSKQDWKTPIQIPLLELYRMRAEQLRQKYDYLILCWSGGGDSTTMLESFLDNNIHLDEVVLLWPLKQTKGRYTVTSNNDSTNISSEWDLTIAPRIKEYETKYPKLKITIIDFLETPNENEYNYDTVRVASKHNYATIQKWRALDELMKKKSEKYSNVCSIFGVSPADTAIVNDRYFMTFFCDGVTGPGSKSDYTLDGWVRHIEFFYWSPDLPEIINAQAHAMYNYCRLNPNKRSLWKNVYLSNSKKKPKHIIIDDELHRQMRKMVLYPKWDNSIFQVKKSLTDLLSHDWYDWLYKNPHSASFLAPWKSAIDSEMRLVDNRFFRYHNNEIADYRYFYSKFYFIGELHEEFIL